MLIVSTLYPLWLQFVFVYDFFCDSEETRTFKESIVIKWRLRNYLLSNSAIA